jgi:hypothetical protein
MTVDALASPGSVGPAHFGAWDGQPPEAICQDVVARLDENLACRGLIDDERLQAELSQTLLFQLPAAADIRRRLDQLETEGLPWVPPFASMVDSLFRHLVEREAALPAHGRQNAPSAEAVDVIERLAAALASLADHSHGYTELGSVMRGVQTELDHLRARSRTAAHVPFAAGASSRHH